MRLSIWITPGVCSILLTTPLAFSRGGDGAGAQPLAHAIPKAPQKSFEPAWVHAAAGLQCNLHAPGSTAIVHVFTDDDEYARFYAVRATSPDSAPRLVLDCVDSAGTASSYSVDLTSEETFSPVPLDPSQEPGTDRPAIIGDPLSYTQDELLQGGYGLRPDPQKGPEAYSRWLASASLPGRLLAVKRPSFHSHTVYTIQAP